jgi:hypothetical protein
MRLPLLLACAFAATPAFAFDMPPRKAGLWGFKATTESSRKSVRNFQQCIDATTDQAMNDFDGGSRPCSKRELQRSGNTITIDTVCNSGAGRKITHVDITGDFDSAYTVKMNVKHEAGPNTITVPRESTTTVEATWLGPCTADQKPGDMILGNGLKMNINDMKDAMPGGTKK